jgi:hypothetical protein
MLDVTSHTVTRTIAGAPSCHQTNPEAMIFAGGGGNCH